MNEKLMQLFTKEENEAAIESHGHGEHWNENYIKWLEEKALESDDVCDSLYYLDPPKYKPSNMMANPLHIKAWEKKIRERIIKPDIFSE